MKPKRVLRAIIRGCLLPLFLALCGPAVGAPWEVAVDGDRQYAEVAQKLAAKRAQVEAIEPIARKMWDTIYEVHLSEKDAKIFTNLITPERVDYWVQLEEPRFAEAKLSELLSLMKDRVFRTDDPEARFQVEFKTAVGSVTWALYPEAYDVLVKSTQDLRLPFVCRVVLLDKDNGILAMANEYLNLEIIPGREKVMTDQFGRPFALTRTVDLTRPVLYTWVQIADQVLMERLGNRLGKSGFKVVPDEGGNVIAEMGGMSANVEAKAEEAFYGKNFDARQIRFLGLPTNVISRVLRLRVLRPTDTLLLYKGME